jgi:hypothetical protein
MTDTITRGERTETKRFTHDDAPFTAADLVVGDRVDPSLVASTLDGLGYTRSARPDAPATQLAEATITHRRDDVHRAILVDGETGVLVRASRHDSQSAWSQKEADWKVRAVGDRVDVESADVEQDGDDEWSDTDAAIGAEHWANVVLQDRARGSTDYEDELTLTSGDSLVLREPYGPTKVYASVTLTRRERDG